MISALSWLPKGAAKAVPTVAEPTEEELAAMREQMEAEAADMDDDDELDEPSSDADADDSSDGGMGEDLTAEEAVAKARAAAAALTSSRSGAKAAGKKKGGKGSSTAADGLDEALRELDMEHYDDSDDDEVAVINRVLGVSGKGRLEYTEGDDPYVTLHNDEDDASEKDDFTIRPTDLIILSAKNEDDVSNLEVWIYEEGGEDGEANLYVHHDVLLPALPLALAWLNCDPSGSTQPRNLVATGTMEPGIEIWDLDVIDSVEPLACLGGVERSMQAEEASTSAAGEDGSKGGDKKKKKVRAGGPGASSGWGDATRCAAHSLTRAPRGAQRRPLAHQGRRVCMRSVEPLLGRGTCWRAAAAGAAALTRGPHTPRACRRRRRPRSPS